MIMFWWKITWLWKITWFCKIMWFWKIIWSTSNSTTSHCQYTCTIWMQFIYSIMSALIKEEFLKKNEFSILLQESAKCKHLINYSLLSGHPRTLCTSHTGSHLLWSLCHVMHLAHRMITMFMIKFLICPVNIYYTSFCINVISISVVDFCYKETTSFIKFLIMGPDLTILYTTLIIYFVDLH